MDSAEPPTTLEELVGNYIARHHHQPPWQTAREVIDLIDNYRNTPS